MLCSRHGARTPLTDAYWEGATWDKGTDCGEAFEALKISVRDLDGGPRPPATHDAAQVFFLMIMHSLIGSCTWCEAPPGTVVQRTRNCLVPQERHAAWLDMALPVLRTAWLARTRACSH